MLFPPFSSNATVLSLSRPCFATFWRGFFACAGFVPSLFFKRARAIAKFCVSWVVVMSGRTKLSLVWLNSGREYLLVSTLPFLIRARSAAKSIVFLSTLSLKANISCAEFFDVAKVFTPKGATSFTEQSINKFNALNVVWMRCEEH